MSYTISHNLSQQPKLPSLFAKALIGGKKKAKEIPVINVSLNGVKADKKKVKQYAEVCGFNLSDNLPISYLHILAFPLHMQILTSDEFPYPLLGLVHVSNEITQYRKIKLNERLDYFCSLAEKRDVEKGEEFDIYTRVESNGEIIWESVSTMLNRSKSKDSGSKTPPAETPDFGADEINQWNVKADIGRRYARVSGDFNLIHIHKITAKLFGFNSAIAHGMWSKAHLLAQLESQMPDEPVKVAVKFKLPMLLPAKVQLQHKAVDGGIEFQLMDKTGEKPHLAGTIQKA